MVRTRFSADNVVLSILGALLACANVMLMGMMYGFGDMPGGAVRKFFILAAGACNDISAIIFITMFFWCSARAATLRVTTVLFVLFSLLGGALAMNWLPLLILIAVAAIAGSIDTRSTQPAVTN